MDKGQTLYNEYRLVNAQSEQAAKDYLGTLSLSDYRALVEHLEILWQASYLKLEDSNGNKMARTRENLAHS